VTFRTPMGVNCRSLLWQIYWNGTPMSAGDHIIIHLDSQFRCGGGSSMSRWNPIWRQPGPSATLFSSHGRSCRTGRSRLNGPVLRHSGIVIR